MEHDKKLQGFFARMETRMTEVSTDATLGCTAPNSNSGVSDQQSVGTNPQVVTLVSLSETLLGRKAVCPMCCVTHLEEPSALIEKRRGSPRCLWLDWQHIAPCHSTL